MQCAENEYGRYRGTIIKKESFADPSNSSCGIICTEDRTLRFRGSAPGNQANTRISDYRCPMDGVGLWLDRAECVPQAEHVCIVVQPGNKIPSHNPACRSSSRGTWY